MLPIAPRRPTLRGRRAGFARSWCLAAAVMLWLTLGSLQAGPPRHAPMRSSGGTAHAGVPRSDPAAVAALANDLRALGAGVDAGEATDLAAAAAETLRQLRLRYRMVPGRLWHNLLVNVGLRERGLCYHWAEDLATALRALGLRSLAIRPVVARPGSLREHHAVLVTVPGGPSAEGLILDGWRHSGRLFWIRRTADRAYPWQDTGD